MGNLLRLGGLLGQISVIVEEVKSFLNWSGTKKGSCPKCCEGASCCNQAITLPIS